MVRFFKSFYAKKVFTYDVMSCITLDVTLSFHRGVYCSHGDAPEGAVLEERFFGDWLVGWLVVVGAVLRVFPCATFEIKSVSYHLIAKNQTEL